MSEFESNDMPATGYLFGYGSLVEAKDEWGWIQAGRDNAVNGWLLGFRRHWRAAMENCAAINDRVHYVDAESGLRPDICVVALSVERAVGRVNGVALPVDAEQIEALDTRELHYDRIDVTADFSEALGAPVWTYSANRQAVAHYESCCAGGRAFISRAYLQRVEAAFRALGEDAWADYTSSTDPPGVPLRDLEHVICG